MFCRIEATHLRTAWQQAEISFAKKKKRKLYEEARAWECLMNEEARPREVELVGSSRLREKPLRTPSGTDRGQQLAAFDEMATVLQHHPTRPSSKHVPIGAPPPRPSKSKKAPSITSQSSGSRQPAEPIGAPPPKASPYRYQDAAAAAIDSPGPTGNQPKAKGGNKSGGKRIVTCSQLPGGRFVCKKWNDSRGCTRHQAYCPDKMQHICDVRKPGGTACGARNHRREQCPYIAQQE